MKRSNEREALIPTIGLVCIARSTFAVEAASESASNALAALKDLNWQIVGDAKLLMDAKPEFPQSTDPQEL